MWSYDASLESLMGYDPERAEAILDEAGWTRDGDGVRQKDGENLSLLWLLSEQTLPVGQFIQAELRKIGMEVELQVLAGAGLTEATLKGEHNISGGSGEWIQEDPDVVRNWLHSSLIDVRQNPVRVRDADLDALLDSGIAFAGDPHDPEREEIYKQIQRTVMEGAFVIPLYYNRSLEAYRANLAAGFQNFGFDPYGTYHEWLDVWMDE
jgi:peptide/nickel transport system substrate-binding protein